MSIVNARNLALGFAGEKATDRCGQTQYQRQRKDETGKHQRSENQILRIYTVKAGL